MVRSFRITCWERYFFCGSELVFLDPEVEERIMAEICKILELRVHDGDTEKRIEHEPVFRPEEIKKMDYLQAALSETLRLYPSVPVDHKERELHPEPVYLVAEEKTEDLQKNGSEAFFESIVNNALAFDEFYATSTLSVEDVRKAIGQGRSEGGPNGRHWILDPIDGTKGFLKGEYYAVALSLLVEGKVVLGVMACPNLKNHKSSSSDKVGCLFFATAGEGAYMQWLEGDSRPEKVQVSNIENHPSNQSPSIAPSPMYNTKLGIRALPVRIHSQVKYAALARGDAEIYLRFTLQGYHESIENHAAGAIIVTEAGGLVCDADGNPPDFSRGKHLHLKRGIVVSTKKLMPRLLEAIKKPWKRRCTSHRHN